MQKRLEKLVINHYCDMFEIPWKALTCKKILGKVWKQAKISIIVSKIIIV